MFVPSMATSSIFLLFAFQLFRAGSGEFDRHGRHEYLRVRGDVVELWWLIGHAIELWIMDVLGEDRQHYRTNNRSASCGYLSG